MDTTQTRFSAIQVGIVLLAVATALIHIALAIPENLIMFYMNGLGYLALTAALFLPQFEKWRGLVRWALMGFTAITVIGWVAIGERIPIAYVDKIIELALIALLWIEARQEQARQEQARQEQARQEQARQEQARQMQARQK